MEDNGELELRGDGGETPGDALVSKLKGRIDELRQDLERLGLADARAEAQAALSATWRGQSPDARRWSLDDEEPAQPFDGAVDQTIRHAETVVLEHLRVCMRALRSATARITGRGADDAARAGRLAILLRWLVTGRLRRSWQREWRRAFALALADCPAAAVLRIDWTEQTDLTLAEVTLPQLLDMASAASGGAAADLSALLDSGAAFSAETLAEMLLSLFPNQLRAARARRAAEELLETSRCRFPVRRLLYAGPTVRALRLYEDVWLPPDCASLEEADVWFETEWLTRTEVRARAADEGWSEGFTTEFLEKAEAQDAFNPAADVLARRGRYQLVHAWFTTTDEDGVRSRMLLAFSPFCETAPLPARPIPYRHGRWPAVLLQREWEAARVADSRGIAELAAAAQQTTKLMLDALGDNALIAATPVYVSKGRRGGRLFLQPFEEVPLRRDGELSYLQPPQAPATAMRIIDEQRALSERYWGVGASGPERQEAAAAATEDLAAWALSYLSEASAQLVALAQQYLDEATVARITDARGEQVFGGTEDLAGEFDVDFDYDPRDADPDHIAAQGKIVSDLILALDEKAQIDKAALVRAFLWRLSPTLAADALRGQEAAAAGELDDERSIYTAARGGVPPPVEPAPGMDFAARAGFYRSLLEENPQALDDLAPDKRALVERRIQALAFQLQQHTENAQIGRTGVPAAPGADPAASAMPPPAARGLPPGGEAAARPPPPPGMPGMPEGGVPL